MTHSLYRKEDIDRVREALQLNATYGKPGSRDVDVAKAIEALALLDAGKDVTEITQTQYATSGHHPLLDIPFNRKVYAITQPDKEKTA